MDQDKQITWHAKYFKSSKEYFFDRKFFISIVTGIIFLAISLVIQFMASNYATRSISEPVTDIILSNTRPFDVDDIFTWGAIILILFTVFVSFMHVKRLPFIIKSVALFVLIRSIFVSLTHISPFPTHILISSAFFRDAIFNGVFNYNDLFFSGHTGMPFLLALMFWDNKKLRYIFLGFSILFAIVVLLGHLHYSIDVLAAFFITYSIFHICKFVFKKDWELFLK